MSRAWSETIEAAKNIVQIGALIIAGFIAYHTDIVPESLRPGDYTPHLNLSAHFKLDQVLNDRAIVSASMHIINQSKAFIQILGASYELRAFRTQNYTEYDDVDENVLINLASELNSNPHELSPWHILPRESVRIISTGRIISDEYSLSPREEYTYQIALPILCKFDVIVLSIKITFLSGNEEKFQIKWKEANGRLSWILRVREDDQYVNFDPHNKRHTDAVAKEDLVTTVARRELVLPIAHTQDGGRYCVGL